MGFTIFLYILIMCIVAGTRGMGRTEAGNGMDLLIVVFWPVAMVCWVLGSVWRRK